MSNDLTGKVAIVTGGNSGIGTAIVLALAEAGANVVIDYVAHPEATDALEKQIAALGDQSIGVDADVSKVADLQTLVDAAVTTFGRLDIMVNNAGVETRTSVLDTTEEQYDKVLAVNLKSAFFGTQLAAKQMIAQGGGGVIINITSVHEDWPMPGNTAYCLSKGGMRMLTRTAGVELAAQGRPRRRRRAGRGGDADQHRGDGPRHAEEARRRHPARPHGQARGDRQRRRVPRERRRQLPHRHDDLRRRRHHDAEPRACSGAPLRQRGRRPGGPTYAGGMGVVVTGANGHVGVNLVRALREAGRDVVAVDVRPPVEALRLGASWVAADVRDRSAMRSVLDGAEVVFHLAAVISVVGSMSGLVESVNVGGVSATAAAALDAGVPRFVHCSSVHAFDLAACRDVVVTEESPRSCRGSLPAYDRSKAAGEAALRRVVAKGLDAVVLNPSGIIGPRDDVPSRMGAVLLAAARGRLPATVRGAFDWVDVRDVVTALLAAEHAGEAGENYLIGGRSAGVAELASLAARAAGHRARLVDLPMGFARVWAPVATLVARRSQNPLLYTRESLHALQSRPRVDHSRAASVLGHDPRPLEDTVTDLIASFADTGLVDVRRGADYGAFVPARP